MMTQEVLNYTLLGIEAQRKEIVKQMKAINKKSGYGYPLPCDTVEYEMLKNELYKLDYQAIELKEQVAE